MKMLMIMCEESVAGDVREVLSQMCIEGCFVEFQKAHASIGSEKRMDSPAFPGTANVFMLPLPEDKVEELKEKVKHLRTSCPFNCCLKIMALDAQEVL